MVLFLTGVVSLTIFCFGRKPALVEIRAVSIRGDRVSVDSHPAGDRG
jgi:hypothetical protein